MSGKKIDSLDPHHLNSLFRLQRDPNADQTAPSILQARKKSECGSGHTSHPPREKTSKERMRHAAKKKLSSMHLPTLSQDPSGQSAWKQRHREMATKKNSVRCIFQRCPSIHLSNQFGGKKKQRDVNKKELSSMHLPKLSQHPSEQSVWRQKEAERCQQKRTQFDASSKAVPASI